MLQILRSHRRVKPLTGELQNAMVAPVTPSKAELNRHGSIGVLASVVVQLIRSRSEPTPDLIILDWNLPDFSGIDICQRIRAGEITIPIMMLTGHDEITDRVKALDAGVDDYLIKPFPSTN